METIQKILSPQYISYVISIMTIFSSLFLKVPQIKNIWAKQSAEGLLVKSMLMEITGYSIMTLYNFTRGYDILTYLEYPIILSQVYVMLYLVLRFKNHLCDPIVPIATATYITLVVLFGSEVIPKTVISHLVPFCTPLAGFAKISYIYGIVQAGNADAVALSTWVISIMTNLARVFTIYIDSADAKLLCNFVIAAALSGAVLATAAAYQRSPRDLRRRKSRSRSVRRLSRLASLHEHHE